MPELPEVETTKRGIENAITNQAIQSVIVRQPRLRWPVPPSIKTQLSSQKILSVSRRAKYLLLETANAGTIIIHLGMSGRLHLVPLNTPAEKHDHVDFIFKDIILRYTDPRRFGCILHTTAPPFEHKLLSKLGPEPLGRAFTAKLLHQKSRNRNVSIKQFIMNHHIVVGVGNIYACEALFIARISPKTAAGKISLDRYQLLVKHIKKILRKAIKAGGTTLKDFYSATGKPGYFSQQLHVYNREGQPCSACQRPIKKIILGQRSSFYCTQCQT